jgi:hypothetical protein
MLVTMPVPDAKTNSFAETAGGKPTLSELGQEVCRKLRDGLIAEMRDPVNLTIAALGASDVYLKERVLDFLEPIHLIGDSLELGVWAHYPKSHSFGPSLMSISPQALFYCDGTLGVVATYFSFGPSQKILGRGSYGLRLFGVANLAQAASLPIIDWRWMIDPIHVSTQGFNFISAPYTGVSINVADLIIVAGILIAAVEFCPVAVARSREIKTRIVAGTKSSLAALRRQADKDE